MLFLISSSLEIPARLALLFTHASRSRQWEALADFRLTSQCDRVIAAGISLYEDPYAISTSTASL